MSLVWQVGLALGIAALLPALVVSAPLDLRDATPRAVEVRLEVSPEDAPGRLDERWSPPLPAWLEPLGGGEGWVRIRIPAEEIEAHLRAFGTRIVPGTFSEFVWVLEPETGHVVRAELRGRVQEELEMGFLQTTAEVAIEVEMSTRRRGGFRPDARLFGQRTHGYCSAPEGGDEGAGDCRVVPVSPLDPRSGYVNAVGSVEARIPLARHRVFSPLGEARFSERTASGGTPAAALGPQPMDAVCSRRTGVPCGTAPAGAAEAVHGGKPWSLERTLRERPALDRGTMGPRDEAARDRGEDPSSAIRSTTF